MVQAMAWCRLATSHYMSQCLPRSLAPYGVTRPQWVNLDIANHLLHVVWICPGNGLVPIRQQAFNRTHDDKDKMFKKWLYCINSNWKYVEYRTRESIGPSCYEQHMTTDYGYRQVSNIRRTSVCNLIVDHSDVVGASPVGAAPTTSSFST